MSKYARRVDINQPQVTKELRDLGLTVGLTYTVGKGFPDFVVGIAGFNHMVELKSSEKSPLTKDEVDFQDAWLGQYDVHVTTKSILFGILDAAARLDSLPLATMISKVILKDLKNGL